jgi:predicted acetyltransferase
VRPLVAADRPVVERLWQLYAHDMSAFRGSLPADDGLFGWGRLPAYLAQDPDRASYVVQVGAAPAGFAFVRGLLGPTRVVGEFFVVGGARGTGTGLAVATEVMRLHPGAWEIPFQDENVPAARFWRRLATDLAGGGWTEEARAVPARPDLPADRWISLVVDPDGASATAADS